MAVLLTAYLLVLLGAIALVVGLIAHGRGENYGRYLAGVGGALALIGILLIAYFLTAFG